MIEIAVPMLGQSGMEVTIESWSIQEGERINKGETLYTLFSQKLTQEIESPVSGTLKTILKAADEVVEPGEIIAHMEAD